jgi:hypothetical protein
MSIHGSAPGVVASHGSHVSKTIYDAAIMATASDKRSEIATEIRNLERTFPPA